MMQHHTFSTARNLPQNPFSMLHIPTEQPWTLLRCSLFTAKASRTIGLRLLQPVADSASAFSAIHIGGFADQVACRLDESCSSSQAGAFACRWQHFRSHNPRYGVLVRLIVNAHGCN